MMIEAIVASDEARGPIRLPISRLYNLGSATRDPETARAHQEEVKDIGISIAFDVPAPRIYPIAVGSLTSGDTVQVQCERTSGEVEIVLIMADELYVGVGSDHTDRLLEQTSILWSKQACPNVYAPKFWRFSEVADHWDSCRMRSWVDRRLYQDCSVKDFLRPEDMIRIVNERTAGLPDNGWMIFGGTIAAIDKTMGFGSHWRFDMTDPILGRAIEHSYSVVNLLDQVRPDFRVPLVARSL
jgi:4-hydroxyphenylacetate 3-monooxygenase